METQIFNYYLDEKLKRVLGIETRLSVAYQVLHPKYSAFYCLVHKKENDKQPDWLNYERKEEEVFDWSQFLESSEWVQGEKYKDAVKYHTYGNISVPKIPGMGGRAQLKNIDVERKKKKKKKEKISIITQNIQNVDGINQFKLLESSNVQVRHRIMESSESNESKGNLFGSLSSGIYNSLSGLFSYKSNKSITSANNGICRQTIEEKPKITSQLKDKLKSISKEKKLRFKNSKFDQFLPRRNIEEQEESSSLQSDTEKDLLGLEINNQNKKNSDVDELDLLDDKFFGQNDEYDDDNQDEEFNDLSERRNRIDQLNNKNNERQDKSLQLYDNTRNIDLLDSGINSVVKRGVMKNFDFLNHQFIEEEQDKSISENWGSHVQNIPLPPENMKIEANENGNNREIFGSRDFQSKLESQYKNVPSPPSEFSPPPGCSVPKMNQETNYLNDRMLVNRSMLREKRIPLPPCIPSLNRYSRNELKLEMIEELQKMQNKDGSWSNTYLLDKLQISYIKGTDDKHKMMITLHILKWLKNITFKDGRCIEMISKAHEFIRNN